MDPIIDIFVPGIPRPGGSKTATVIRRKGGEIVMKNGRPLVAMRDDAKGNAEWKQVVKFFAAQGYDGAPLQGPLLVVFHFTMPRPKSHFNTKGELRPSATIFHTVKPDATKLARSTEDALTGVFWLDDAQIAAPLPLKTYGDKPGCRIQVMQLAGSTEIPDVTKVVAPLFANV